MPAPQRADVVETLERYFASSPAGVVAAWLFGSVARETARPGSDVDVAVLFESTPGPALDAGPLDLEAELERLLRRETQLVVMNRAPVDLVHRVLREGILVCETDPRARVRFEVKARNDYFDLLPHLHRYRRHA